MSRALEDRIKRGKQNNELEQMLSRGQAELERLQHELKDEESDAFETSELNSEVCVRLAHGRVAVINPTRC